MRIELRNSNYQINEENSTPNYKKKKGKKMNIVDPLFKSLFTKTEGKKGSQNTTKTWN